MHHIPPLVMVTKRSAKKQHRWLPIEVQWRTKLLVFHINQSLVFHVDEQAMNVRQ